jgi:hypothetical protein
VPQIPQATKDCQNDLSSCYSNPVFIQFNNQMDYTEDDCRKWFTSDQTDIMQSVLYNYKNSLAAPSNVNLRGLTCCINSANFTLSNNELCISPIDTITAIAYKYSNASYTYTLKKGSTILQTQTDTTGIFRYHTNQAGVYTLTLTFAIPSLLNTLSHSEQFSFIDCGKALPHNQGNWYFGEFAGLRFTEKTVVKDVKPKIEDPNNIFTSEGTISQSDSLGRLLFYGGGDDRDTVFRIYNKNYKEMQGGPIYGHGSSSGAGIVIPVPKQWGKYYLITTPAVERQHMGLYYHVIDMNANGGLGAITSKNQDIQIPKKFKINGDSALKCNEQIAAIPKCDGRGYWVVVGADSFNNSNQLVSQNLIVYSVNTNGIQFYKNVKLEQPTYYPIGQFKFSPDGNYFATEASLFSFNRKYANFQFLKYIATNASPFSVSFSPNSKFVYVKQAYTLGFMGDSLTIYQHDLLNPSLPAQEVGIIDEPNYLSHLQLGPNNKLYIGALNSNRLFEIKNPNKVADPLFTNAVGFTKEGPLINKNGLGGQSKAGLPNMIDAKKINEITTDFNIVVENCFQYKFKGNNCCSQNYKWIINNISYYTKDVNYTYPSKGVDTVYFIADGDTVKRRLDIGIEKPLINGKNKICDTSNIAYYSSKHVPHRTYAWTSSSTIVTDLNDVKVAWKDTGYLKLKVTDFNGCKDSQVLRIEFLPIVSNNQIDLPMIDLCMQNEYEITGTLPIGGNGNYSYIWIAQEENASNWEYLKSETNRNLVHRLKGNIKYQRVVKSGDCINFSNTVTASSAPNENKIFEYYMTGDWDKCDLKLKGTDIKKNFPMATVVWQKSIDSVTWTTLTTASDTQTNSLEINLAKVYYRRVCSLDTCILYSNVLTYSNILPVSSITIFCKDLEFPFTLNFKKPTGNYTVSFEYKRDTSYIQYNNAMVNYTNNTITVYQHSDTSYRIKKGDKMRIRFSNNGCGHTYNDFFSNEIIPEYMDTFYFISHPQNQTISGGNAALFSVLVNKPEMCTFAWEFSDNGGTNWKPINNSNNDTLKLENTTTCFIEHLYRCKVQSPCSTVNSNSATLIINSIGSPTFDYWMKNTDADVGNEPDSFSTSFVTSKDIWIRHNNDGIKQHQDLNTKATINYVYVTIRNKGTTPAPSAKLFTYWTWGGTQESWPKNWTYNSNNLFFNVNQYYPMGGEINKLGINIPEIPANDSIDIAIPWKDFPKYGWFNLNKQWKNDRINICILARIVTCDNAPFGMTNPEQTDVFYNIKHNNNIVSRNTYTLPLVPLPPKEDEEGGNNGEIYHTINPNIIDAGTIAVRNNDEEARKSTICIKTIDVAYFDKAETYIEIGEALKTAIEWSPSVVYSGLTHVVDNIYQVSSANACFEDVVLPAHFQDAVLPLFAYKDINDRFADGLSFNTSIQQKDSLGYLLGECIFTLTDNLFVNPELTYIENDTAFYICNTENADPETLTAEYVYPAAFPYVVLDDNNEEVAQEYTHTYHLNQGTYRFMATDSSTFTKYITSVYVEVNTDCLPDTIFQTSDTVLYFCNNGISPNYVNYSVSPPLIYQVFDEYSNPVYEMYPYNFQLYVGNYTVITYDSTTLTHHTISVEVAPREVDISYFSDTLSYDCELGYFEFYALDENTKVYNEFNDQVTETSTNYYELDAVNHQYKTIYTNIETCESDETTLHFIDEYYLPETIVATIYGDFNTETDTCAFFKVDELLCNGNAINSSPTIEVFDISGIYLLTTSFVFHETRGNGFYFCPPYWNNEPEHIYDWYSLVIRTDFCDYCRFDFRYDSTGIYDRQSSISNISALKNRVMLYPNPANQDVNIHILGVAETGLETITIQILDQTGRILEDKVHTLNKDGNIKLTMEQYANGVYFIKIPALKYDGKVVLIKD